MMVQSGSRCQDYAEMITVGTSASVPSCRQVFWAGSTAQTQNWLEALQYISSSSENTSRSSRTTCCLHTLTALPSSLIRLDKNWVITEFTSRIHTRLKMATTARTPSFSHTELKSVRQQLILPSPPGWGICGIKYSQARKERDKDTLFSFYLLHKIYTE